VHQNSREPSHCMMPDCRRVKLREAPRGAPVAAGTYSQGSVIRADLGVCNLVNSADG